MYEIDGNQLEIECIKQIDMIEDSCFAAAEAKVRLDEAKARLDRYERLADQTIRANPRDHGLLKSTEAGIAKAVKCHPNVVKAMTELNHAKTEVTRLDAVVVILEHRKRMLEQLVKLQGQGYFSDVPKQPRYNEPEGGSRPLR